jgi:PPOX class probable F420-dependent enzyme
MVKLPDIIKRLAKMGKNFASIATLMPDGSPHVSVVWVDSDEKHLIINTAEGRVKTNNLQRDPRIALTITNSENPYQQVMVRDRVVEITDEGADEHIDGLAKKYLDVDKYPHRAPGERRVIVKIFPESIFSIGENYD